MIQLCDNGDTRAISGKPKTYKAPTLDGRKFAIEKAGPFYEVRARTYAAGRKTGDQLVAALESEKDADAMVVFLQTKGEAAW